MKTLNQLKREVELGDVAKRGRVTGAACSSEWILKGKVMVVKEIRESLLVELRRLIKFQTMEKDDTEKIRWRLKLIHRDFPEAVIKTHKELMAWYGGKISFIIRLIEPTPKELEVLGA